MAESSRTRWLASAAVPFRRAWRWFVFAPRAVQFGLVLAVVVGVAAWVHYTRSYLTERARERAAAAAWAAFTDAARRADVPAMSAALDRVLAARSDDPTATRRRDALRLGEAPPDDVELAVALQDEHARHGRLPEAAREARKVLAHRPGHWRAVCVLAHHAIAVERDPAACRRWLDTLPDPWDAGSGLEAGGLVYAVRLSRAVGRDAGPLRAAIVSRVIPLVRTPAAETAPPADKLVLLECYLEGFAHSRAQVGELSAYWGVTGRLADLAVSEAAETGDVATLIRLGGLGPQLFRALAVIRESERHDPARVAEVDARFETLARELADRTRRAWLAARAKDPARWEPYRGLADVAVREGNRPEAARVLREGIAACGGRVELLEALTRLLAADDPGEGLRVAWAEAEAAGSDPAKWCLAASAAIAAGERARAIAACEHVRRSVPSHPWACTAEAGLWLEDGQSGRALELLVSVGKPALWADPVRARRFARAMVESGRPMREVEEAADEAKAAAEPRSPVVPVAFLRGVLDARPPTADRAAWVASRAEKLLAVWPDHTPTRRVLADALYRQSGLSDPPWAIDPARAALRAYQNLPTAERAGPAVAAAVAGLHLNAFRDPAAAIRVLAPVCIAPTAGTAGCWVQLARAYHAAGRPADARAALATASTVPNRTAREEADRREAEQLLERRPGH
jgi:predicted Zn-dependent protease